MLALPLSVPLKGQTLVLIGEGVWLKRKYDILRATEATLKVYTPFGDEGFGAVQAWPIVDDVRAARFCVVAFAARDKAEQGAALVRQTPVWLNVVDYPDLSDFHFPAIIERGAITIGVASGGTVPVLARQIRGAIEAAVPPSTTELANWASGFSTHLRAAISDVDQRRKLWETILDSDVAELARQGDFDGATSLARSIVMGETAKDGKVYLVGAGPGDPELLTLKALRILNSADVLVYDRLVGDGILALARRDADRYYVGKERSYHALPQNEIHALLVKEAKAGKTVVRLKGGDSFIFGRGGEEVDALLAENIAVEVVPGISTALAAGAQSLTPLTHREHANAVTFVTGHAHMNSDDTTPDLNWPSLAQDNQTVVVYMGIHTAKAIQAQLLSHGRAADTPVLVAENVSRENANYRHLTLSTFASELERDPPSGPALLMIGRVAASRQESLK